MKNINISLTEKEFFRLLKIKDNLQMQKKKKVTWKDLMFLLKIKNERKN